MKRDMSDALLKGSCEELERNKSRQAFPGFPPIPSIPAGRYVDSRLWDLERSLLWRRTWLIAGNVDQLPESGSYILWREAGLPIILVRGKDDVIRAFYNTCQHRGGPLVHDESGRSPVMSCKFHQWTYDLTGKLVSIPDQHEFVDLNPDEINLRQLRCELWGKFIFINCDLEAEPLLDFLGPIVEHFSDLKMDERGIYEEASYELKSNWKIAVASNLEVYHLPPVHPKTVNQWLDLHAAPNYLYRNGHALQLLLQKEGEQALEASAFKSEGSNLDPEHEITRKTVRNYFIFPNLLISAAEFQFALVVYWPVDIRTSRWQVLYTAPEGHDDPQSEGCRRLVDGFDTILLEDIANLVSIQESYEKGLIDKARLSYAERRIAHFEEEVDRRIGPDRVPAEIRITPVLAPFVVEPNDIVKACRAGAL